MAKKNKNIEQETTFNKRSSSPQVVFARVPRGVPVARPASNIQLTPIVQPVAFVPYSTNSQPLLTMEEYDNNY